MSLMNHDNKLRKLKYGHVTTLQIKYVEWVWLMAGLSSLIWPNTDGLARVGLYTYEAFGN